MDKIIKFVYNDTYMTIKNQKHLEVFKVNHDQYKKWTGINALDWGRYINPNLSSDILNKKLTRDDLLSKEFTDKLTDDQFSIAILSWGGMNRDHGLSLFKESEWLELVSMIRKGEIKSRSDAYEKFHQLRKQNKLPGMGPAYFTKMICFLNPKLNGYIMDQWTSKSINLLMNENIVKLTRAGFVESTKNDEKTYAVFCEVIDEIAIIMKMRGVDVEEALFSSGGKNRGSWRRFLVDNWSNSFSDKLFSKMSYELDLMSYDEVLEDIGDNKLTIDTLALRSKFNLYSVDNEIVIELSSGKRYNIGRETWALVLDRIKELPIDEYFITSRYSDGKSQFNWTNCPNRIICPYIPAILKFFNN